MGCLAGFLSIADAPGMSSEGLLTTAILAELPEGLARGELLGFPEVAVVARDQAAALHTLRRLAAEVARDDPAIRLAGRAPAATPMLEELEVMLTPARAAEGWDQPLPIRLPLLVWAESDRHVVGHLPGLVPGLGFSVTAASAAGVRERAAAATLRIASRMGATRDLRWWASLQRRSRVSLAPTALETRTPTALARAQAAADEAKAEDGERSVLEEVTTDLTTATSPPAHEVDATLRALADTLRARPSEPHRCALLVGPSGVGKTAAIGELVRRRGEFGLASTPFRATDGSRLVSGMTGFGAWEERCGKLASEASRGGVVLVLGNLVELMQAGRHQSNALGIASFFRPRMERGDLRVIAEVTDAQRQLVEREDPGLLAAFEILRVDPPEAPRRRAILRAVGRHATGQAPSEGALLQVDALHERFATHSAAPGRAVGFLRNLLRETPAPTASDVTVAFAKQTGLPRFLLDPAVLFDPEACRAALAADVLGQPAAVGHVTDAVTVAKADLGRPGRPIASFLFAGPTGVGKTQLARATAAFLFGDPARMTRFDMSEYASPAAVARLTSRPGGSGEGLLTAKVREQPFALLLFDEFEKAHPAFFDLLLQVLGEGRLTDAAGRTADFTQCVIVMTSNLGAGDAGGSRFGFGRAERTAAERAEAYVEAARDALRPELFNRIDRIVAFAPLDREAVRAIVERELERVADRDGFRLRGIRLDVAPAAARLLAEEGFDPHLGARPLQRAIDRRVLAPLADQLNGHAANTPVTASVEVANGELRTRVRANPDAASVEAGTTARVALERVVADRRRAQKLVACSVAVDLENEAEKLRRDIAQRKREGRADAWTDPALQHLPALESLLKSASAAHRGLEEAEDALAWAFYGEAVAAGERSDGEADAERARRIFERVLLDVHDHRFADPDELVLATFGNVKPMVFHYADVAAQAGFQLTGSPLFVWEVGRNPKPKGGAAIRAGGAPENAKLREQWADGDRVPWRGHEGPLMDRSAFRSPARTFGFLLRVRGARVASLFAGETGRHLFKADGDESACVVEIAEGWATFVPPEGVQDAQASGGAQAVSGPSPLRRVYDSDRSILEDRVLDQRTGWRPGRTGSSLFDLLSASRAKAIEEMLRR